MMRSQRTLLPVYKVELCCQRCKGYACGYLDAGLPARYSGIQKGEPVYGGPRCPCGATTYRLVEITVLKDGIER
jgi:hypothetical protein